MNWIVAGGTMIDVTETRTVNLVPTGNGRPVQCLQQNVLFRGRSCVALHILPSYAATLIQGDISN